MQVLIHKNCEKGLHKLPSKIHKIFLERLALFIDTPFAPELKNHPLRGDFSGKRSINITGDIRVIYEELSDGNVVFHAIGTHHQLYGT